MNKTMQKVLSIVLTTLMCITSLPLIGLADEARQPREWFVSLNGNDETGTGTIDKPFRTLQKGADMLQAGDTLYIREGVYDESFKLKSSGTAQAPITIKNYNDEVVTVRATTKLANWNKATDIGENIWVTDMTFDKKTGGWGDDVVFVGEKPLHVARYPNIPEGGSKMWPAQLYMDSAARTTTDKDTSEKGYIEDAELTQPDGYWDGATAHMQSGLNWYNVLATVSSYTTGRLNLINHNYSNGTSYNEAPGNGYYIEDHINALDTEDEFYINRETKKVYICSKENPNKLEIGARNNVYVIDVSDVAYVNIEGFNLRAAGIRYNGMSNNINVEWLSIGGIEGMEMLGHHNTIKHSHIYDSPAGLISIGVSEYNAIFNCLIEDGGWSGKNSANASVAAQATYAYFAYNTVRNAGRSTFGARGSNCVYEYNHFYNAGSVTCDTGICYTGVISPGTSEFRYNWLHDMTAAKTAFGLYFDNSGNNTAVHHNVVWDNDNTTGELMMNGWGALLINEPCDGFSVYNNTFIGDSQMTHVREYVNDGRYMNNIFTGEIQSTVHHKMQRNNIVGWLDPGFVDPYNYDFTLRPDSIAIDKGVEIEGVTEGYVGNAPDVGAYEYGGEYWVPGHNWENPPVYEHKTPNYIQWHNLVTHSSFEDDQGLDPAIADQARMWTPEKYGWSIMKESQGLVDQVFNSELHTITPTRRIGNIGVKLGEDMPTTYPGDEIAAVSSKIIGIYNEMGKNFVNFPKLKQNYIYENLPEAFYGLLINAVNMTTWGDFEDPEKRLSTETAKCINTDEDAAGGERSIKIDSFNFSWSGLRFNLPATSDRKFRVSFDAKSTEGNIMKIEFTDRSPTDYNSANHRKIFSKNITLDDGNWQNVSFDLNTNGSTKGIEIRGSLDKHQGSYLYLDNFAMLDTTELYLMKDACAKYPEARAIVDAAIKDNDLTAEKIAVAMKKSAEIVLKGNKKEAVKVLMPILETLSNAKLSAGAGITYTVDNVKPGRTYKLACHACVTNPKDKVQYFVKHGNKILAQWETSKKEWTDEFVTFVAPENGDPVVIEIWKPIGIGAAHVDDVTVREYDPMVYRLRSGIKYIENTDMEDSEIWPWYSFDAKLESVNTDKGQSLKVTGKRAMQDVRTMPTRKVFLVSADMKLAMPGVASREAEINLHIMQGVDKLRDVQVTYPIGKAKITNDGWTHIEGEIRIPADIRMDSIGFTAGLVGEDGVFYLDNASVEERPMPTTPGTGDSMTFEQLFADTKNWLTSAPGDQGFVLSKNEIYTTMGNMGYQGETLRDFRITFEYKIEDFKDGAYPAIAIRAGDGAPSYGTGYAFFIFKDNIELQKGIPGGAPDRYMYMGPPDAPTGTYGPAVYKDAFKMGEWNTITIGTTNLENGVRIYLEVNGEVYYDHVDNVSSIDNSGYISFTKNGVGRVSVRPVQK